MSSQAELEAARDEAAARLEAAETALEQALEELLAQLEVVAHAEAGEQLAKEIVEAARQAVDALQGDILLLLNDIGEQLGQVLDLDSLKDDISSLLNELGTDVTEKIQQELGLANLSKEFNSHAQELVKMGGLALDAIAEAKNLVNSIENTIAATEGDLQALKDESNELMKAIKALELVLNLLERLIDIMLGIIAVLLCLLACCGWWNPAAAASLSAKLSNLSTQLTALRSQVRSVKTVVQATRLTLEIALGRLDLTNKDLVQQIIERGKDIAIKAAKEVAHDVLKSQLEEQMAKIAGNDAELKSLKDALLDKTKEQHQTMAELRDAAKNCVNATSLCNASQEYAQQLAAQLQIAKTDFENAERLHSDAVANLAEARARADELCSTVETLEANVVECAAALANAEAALAELEQENEQEQYHTNM